VIAKIHLTQPKKRKLPNWLASSDEIETLEKRKKEPTFTSETNKENEQHSNINLDNNPAKTNAGVTKEAEVETEISNKNENIGDIAIKEEITETNEIKIKTEPLDNDENTTTNSVLLTQTREIVSSTIKIKIEADESSGEGTSSTSENKVNEIPVATVQPMVVKKEEESIKKEPEAGSSLRPSCKFGIKCYRRNPFHRVEEAHPGDLDYRRPEFPEPPVGTPFCPFGNVCYRRNPVHFQQFSHPPQTDFHQNRLDRQNKLRNRKPIVYNAEYSDDEISSDDDFSAGSEDEYDPENMPERESSADEGVDLNDVSPDLCDDNQGEDE